jgi:hypothetical protein
VCKTTRSRNGSTCRLRARKNDLSYFPVRSHHCLGEYSDDSGFLFVTTELKNSAGALVWLWLFSSDPPCPAHKCAVASYTPGLDTAGDGSVSIVMAVNKPADVPEANWLPIPRGPFNILLRAYGPQNAATYVPPQIQVLLQ